MSTETSPTRADRVLAICRDALERLPPGEARLELERIVERLREPLRVAVAGRAKAGKSTLVNALLRQKVAPTDVSECTKVVTWFRFGYPEVFEVVPKQGEPWRRPLPAAGLPSSLGAEPEAIEAVHVRLSNSALRDMTLVDTPGLESSNDPVSARTREFLAIDRASRDAVARTDVLVFLMTDTAKADDREALAAFSEQLSGTGASALTAVGVLSKADQLAGGDWARASEIAADLAAKLRSRVATVLPLAGLFAESAESGLTEQDASHLRTLAALGAGPRRDMLLSVDRFTKFASPVPAPARRRLVELLGRIGIARCLEWIDSGERGAAALRDRLAGASGIETVRKTLDESFLHSGDALKAHAALNALDRLVHRPAEGEARTVLRDLRNAREDVALDRSMHRIKEIWAIQQVAANRVELPEELLADLRRVTGQASVAERLGVPSDASDAGLEAAAIRGANRWQAYKGDPRTGPDEVRIAEVLTRSYTILLHGLSRTTVEA